MAVLVGHLIQGDLVAIGLRYGDLIPTVEFDQHLRGDGGGGILEQCLARHGPQFASIQGRAVHSRLFIIRFFKR